MTFSATKHPVGNRGEPPDSFLSELVEFGRTMPMACYAPNESNGNHDIFNLIEAKFGPWESLEHRRAVMCEVLRCTAGWESSWNWQDGVDVTNANSLAHIDGQEAGAFQVSYDSIGLHPSLAACALRHCGELDARTFIATMKSNHVFAMEYCALLLRHNTRWSGPANTGNLQASLWPPAIKEFEQLLL